jgi:uncharacterized OB-fold protein
VTDTTRSASRPVPRPTELSKPFWDAARRHELRIQQCTSCGRHVFYPRLSCPHCGARALEWVPVSGNATVYSYTVARRATHPAFADRVPYVIAIVELDEGPRMTTNVVGCAPDDVKIGMRVRATFEDMDDDIALVNFEPA